MKMLINTTLGVGGSLLLTFLILTLLKTLKNHRNKFKRVPIKDFPTPAGWSLQQRVQEAYGDFLVAVSALFLVGMILVITNLLLESTLTLNLTALCFLGFFFYQINKKLKNYQNYSLGLLGEQAVGAKLNNINQENFKVYHDYVVDEQSSSAWNIDHIVVCDTGVFLLETKARRKAKRNGGHEVTLDKDALHFPTSKDTKSLAQAERSAKWLENHLFKLTEKRTPVHPAVVLPGWYIKRKSHSSVKVLNDTNLNTFFQNQPSTLSSEEQNQINCLLSAHCKVVTSDE